MKYLKLFELYVDKPKVGDYIIADIQRRNDQLSRKLAENKNEIGKIEVIVAGKDEPTNKYDEDIFYVNFEGINQKIYLMRYEIEFFSSDKEDVESYLAAKKYNL